MYGRVCRVIPVHLAVRETHVPVFWVFVDVENGEILEILHLSDLSGNG